MPSPQPSCSGYDARTSPDPKQHLILNIGLARCGTTAMAALFNAIPDVSTPRDVKELKFFQHTADIQTYANLFTDPQGQILFESSPPYTGGGSERFTQVLAQVNKLRQNGFDVTILVLLRNLVTRAFSHYWHDISTQYAPYGCYWSVRTKDHPRRLSSLYNKSFLAELTLPKSDAKFLPKIAQMIEEAIGTFGADRVRIAHTAGLDAALNDLFRQTFPGYTLPLPRTPRLRGSSAPVIVSGGSSGNSFAISTRNGMRQITLPAGHAMLVQDGSVELLSGERYNLERLVEASRCWTQSFDPADLPPRVLDYLARQRRAIKKLPEQCFLAGQRPTILQDLATIPTKLEIRLAEPDCNFFPKGF